MPSTPEPMVGEVWEVLVGSGLGREQQGIRPALVVSNDGYNGIPHAVRFVAPITGVRRGVSSHLDIDGPDGGLVKPSVIMCEQLRAVSLLRFRTKRGLVNEATLARAQAMIGMFMNRA